LPSSGTAEAVPFQNTEAAIPELAPQSRPKRCQFNGFRPAQRPEQGLIAIPNCPFRAILIPNRSFWICNFLAIAAILSPREMKFLLKIIV
jgi:hypothetical protein